jgi:predicted naringenin-chalcone synthase
MQFTLTTSSVLLALISLASATPRTNYHQQATATIIRQLAGFDSASTIDVKLDATTNNDRNVKSARMSQPGPWCAGFTDEEAKQPARALNGDGIFDSRNEVIYSTSHRPPSPSLH